MAFKTLFSNTTTLFDGSEQKSARRAARAQHARLVRELSADNTPAERSEIEMAATRTTDPDAVLVLNILDQLTVSGGRESLRQSA